MRRLLAGVLTLCVAVFRTGAQEADSLRFAKLDSILVEYLAAIQTADADEKSAECDFMIGSCGDSSAQNHIALKLYDHFREPQRMGDEAVGIHIFDKWFSHGPLRMRSDIERMDAAINAEFNRHTLIGMQAPEVSLRKMNGKTFNVPQKGRTGILFFYNTSCSTCKAEISLLPQVIENIDFPVDFYAVYTGQDRKAWKEFAGEKFKFHNRKVRVINLWDKDIESNYQMLYGIISTPKIYVTEPSGKIIGRRLGMDTLSQILSIAKQIQEKYE